jgi:hypothetical protein
MNVGIGTVAAQFLSWKYLLRIFRYSIFAMKYVALTGLLDFSARCCTVLAT